MFGVSRVILHDLVRMARGALSEFEQIILHLAPEHVRSAWRAAIVRTVDPKCRGTIVIAAGRGLPRRWMSLSRTAENVVRASWLT